MAHLATKSATSLPRRPVWARTFTRWTGWVRASTASTTPLTRSCSWWWVIVWGRRQYLATICMADWQSVKATMGAASREPDTACRRATSSARRAFWTPSKT